MQKKIGLELRSLNHLIMRYMDKTSHKKQIDAVTGTNGWIIGFLAENSDKDVYQKDLEEKFTITRSTASKVLNLMVKKGLVERHSVAHDARLKKLVLTEKAQKLSELMKEDAKKMESCLTNGFSERELEALTAFIQKMKANIQASL